MKNGVSLLSNTNNKNITRPPRINPAIGEVIIGTITFGQSPSCHLITPQFPFAVATAAPQRPPINAWLELDGKPKNQVIMFQMKAASTALSTVPMVTTSV